MSSHRPCTQRPSWRSRGSTVPAPAAPGPAPAEPRPAERAAGAAGRRRCPAAAASDGTMGVWGIYLWLILVNTLWLILYG